MHITEGGWPGNTPNQRGLRGPNHWLPWWVLLNNLTTSALHKKVIEGQWSWVLHWLREQHTTQRMPLIVIWIERQAQTSLRTKTLSNGLRFCIASEQHTESDKKATQQMPLIVTWLERQVQTSVKTKTLSNGLRFSIVLANKTETRKQLKH